MKRYYLINNQRLSSLSFIIIGFLLSFTSCNNFSNHDQLHKQLLHDANEVNSSCPMMIDRDTRFDNVAIMPDNTSQSYFTFVNVVKSDINIEEVKDRLKSQFLKNLKTSPKQQIARNLKLTEAYIFKDKTGVYLFDITITPDMYVGN